MRHSIIIAAGVGKRFRSDFPKALQPLASAPLIAHVLAQVRRSGNGRIILVIGKHHRGIPEFESLVSNDVVLVEQSQPLGTGDAVRVALHELPENGWISVYYVDTPLVDGTDSLRLVELLQNNGAPVGVLGFRPGHHNHRYGQFMECGDNRVSRIVESKDPDYSKAGPICNSGHMVMRIDKARSWLANLPVDARSGEYYLTDCMALASEEGTPGLYIEVDQDDCIGVDDPYRLAEAEKIWQHRARTRAMKDYGVVMVAPETVYLAFDTDFRGPCRIEPHVFFGPGCTIEAGVHIKAFSYLEGVHCQVNSRAGPFSRVRGVTQIGNSASVGSFVDVKNCHLGHGVKANHLAYLGDATIGENTNIGAGVVICNYDGKQKYETRIGKNAFVGSNVSLIAPIVVGDGAFVAAGSAISSSVPADSLVIERSEVRSKPKGHYKSKSHDVTQK